MNLTKMGQFITSLRNEFGYTQEQLAELIPISRQAISKWERGKSVPDITALLRLSEIFKVNINEIIAGEYLPKEKIDNVTLSIYETANKRAKKIKYLLLVIFILIFLFLAYYFINSYNSIKVYLIKGESDNLILKDGLLILTKEKTYFQLGNLKNTDDKKIKNLKLYYTDINNEEQIIMECQNCNEDDLLLIDHYGYNAYFDYNNIDYILSNIELKVNYDDDSNEKINLDFNRDFANNTLFFKKEQQAASNDIKIEQTNDNKKIIELIEKEFKSQDDSLIYQEENIVATYIENNLYLELLENDYIYNWNYNFLGNVQTFTLYDNNYNELENMSYDFNNEKCLSGECKQIDTYQQMFWDKLELILNY